MTRIGAQTEIRRLAADRSRVIPTEHALKRDPGKGKHPISEREAADCLRQCILDEDPTPDLKLANGWKFTCHRRQEGATTTVAGVLVPGQRIVVITGYEEWHFSRRLRPDPNARDDDDDDVEVGEDQDDD